MSITAYKNNINAFFFLNVTWSLLCLEIFGAWVNQNNISNGNFFIENIGIFEKKYLTKILL